MDKLVIEGGEQLCGRVEISGAKNSVLPIMAATLLTEEKCVIKNVPSLRDVDTMAKILSALGMEVEREKRELAIMPKRAKNCVAPYNLVKTMRASVCVLGPLLAKRGYAKVSLPGGCVIGPRPIDLHLRGLAALGARIKVDHGYIVASVLDGLRGRNIQLGGAFGSSVLATANVMMAATLADGVTVIEDAAGEPEIVDLIDFLIKMGAKILRRQPNIIEIEGVKELKGATHRVIPDRIEAGTYMIASAITGGDVMINNGCFDHLETLVNKLRKIGVNVFPQGDCIRIRGDKRFGPINLTTSPYPGFPTDMQAQMMALVSLAEGESAITEKVYPERFMHVAELNRMGAQITVQNSTAYIKGVNKLTGAPVMASDLRASAALVLAGLIAEGKTEIQRFYHLERGYERMEEKLSQLGAKIWIEEE